MNMVLKAWERLSGLVAESKNKAAKELDSHGSREPLKLIREAQGLSESLEAILQGNPDPDVVQAYSTSIAALALQIGAVAPEHFTNQAALPMSEPEQIHLELVA